MLAQPTISERQIQLIKDSWGRVIVYSSQAGDAFYYELFALAPELQNLFKDNLSSQNRKLLSAVTVIVTKLNKLEHLQEEMQALAHRHKSYGVKPEYFEAFGKAFILMLSRVLGDKWNEEVKQAWKAVYELMSQAMINGLNS